MEEPTQRSEGDWDGFEEKIARLRASPEERARLLAGGRPFDFDKWLREAGPPKPEELAEMEEMMRERAEEREWMRIVEARRAANDR